MKCAIKNYIKTTLMIDLHILVLIEISMKMTYETTNFITYFFVGNRLLCSFYWMHYECILYIVDSWFSWW